MEKNWKWATSGSSLITRSHDEIIEMCQAAGLAGIEGTVTLFDGSSTELEALGGRYGDAGLQIQTFHLPYSADLDLCSFYETRRRRAVKAARTWMERSARLGVTVGIQHPTSSPYDAEVDGVALSMRHLGKSLGELLPAAAELDFTIALENLGPGAYGRRFGSRPQHFADIMREFNHPNLGFNLDTGHALIAGGFEEADEFHAVMAPRIASYHLADNAGDRDSHLAPGHGLVDWDRVFRRAAEFGYAGNMCIETPPFAPGANNSHGPEAWKQMVDDTEALAQRALS